MHFDILPIILLVLLGRAFGILLLRVGLHPLIGEMLGGMVLAAIPFLVMDTEGAMGMLATFSIILLMLLAGLMTDMHSFDQHKKDSIVIGALGVLVTIGMVFAVTYLINSYYLGLTGDKVWISALFIAVVLSNTAIEVSANLFGKSKRRKVPAVIMGASFVDDIMAVFIIGLLSSWLLFGQTPSYFELVLLGVKVTGFLLVSFYILTPLVKKLFDHLIIPKYKNERYPLTTVILLGLGMALLARNFGLHEVIGAYIAGLMVGKWGATVGPMLKRQRAMRRLIDDMEPPISALFGPLFFGYVGVLFYMNLTGIRMQFTLIGLILALLAMSILGKIVGCGLGAKFMDFDNRDSMLIGTGMGGRGALELVLIGFGLEVGVILDLHFVALIIVTMLSIIMTTVLYKLFDNECSYKRVKGILKW